MTATFLESQKNLEFWTEFSDMLAEKNLEIQNAKEKLNEIKAKYCEKIMNEKWEEINDKFIETDGVSIMGYSQKDPSKDINMHTAKIASRMQMLSKTKKNFRVQKEIDMNYDSYLSSDESADENYGDLIKTKAEFYEAVDEILKEIELDFKNISLIMKNFNGLPKELFSF